MTREELQKIIDNGESVWINGIKHKLNKYYFLAEYNNEPTLYLMTHSGYEEDDWDNYPVEAITNIYKTQAEAEHYLHHANVTRVEQLPFLTWEEFLEERHLSFIGKNEIEYMLCIFGDKIDLAEHRACSSFVIKEWHATEENFYKAYDECVRLFRSEE